MRAASPGEVAPVRLVVGIHGAHGVTRPTTVGSGSAQMRRRYVCGGRRSDWWEMLGGIAMSPGFWLVNAETQRAAEVRRALLFSALLRDALRLCVKRGMAVALALPRCVPLWVASLCRLAIAVTILVVTFGWTAWGQIKSAPATNAAVKMAEPGFVGSQSCRECHEKFYQLWSTSFHGLAMQPYTQDLARTNLTEQKTEVIAGKYHFRADIRQAVVLERGPQGVAPLEQRRLETLLGAHLASSRISTMPFFGPGTAPLTMITFSSGSIPCTLSPTWVARLPPMRPGIFIPLNTREG